ncbi:hypothetical protein KCP70_04905 [Salmonella enterica subsp. enterica]|nr:hypothetical protein KCP70_04905 [Salmonella enterica subsp. enterica]
MDHASFVRQSSDYLVDTFAAFRKATHKTGCAGTACVAEPQYHDGHRALVTFCALRAKDRRSITARCCVSLLIREDRERSWAPITSRQVRMPSTRAQGHADATSPNTSSVRTSRAG